MNILVEHTNKSFEYVNSTFETKKPTTAIFDSTDDSFKK